MNDAANAGQHLLPRWARICGWVFLAGQTLFVGRIVFESTVLTSLDGPQMVGFSLMHGGHNLILLSLPFIPLALFWFLSALIFGLLKKLRFRMSEWVLLVALLTSFSLLLIPYPAWEHFDVVVFGAGSHGNQFLNDAAANGDLRLVKRLLAKGYGVNQESGGGVTPLSAAVVGNKEEIVTFLLSKGANVNSHSILSGETPLMAAAEMGHTAILKLLLARGAEPCATNREGQNALNMARRYHHQVMADYLSSFHCPPPPDPCAGKSSDTCVVVH